MVNLVPNMVRETWNIWNIGGLVLASLTLQVFLLLSASLRKRTNAGIVTLLLWSAYLLADYVATFCIGLIFDKRENISTGSVNNYVIVFWTPFLLLHLGGPDSITAFSLEDNELWLRHLLSLVFQLVATVYLFFLTIPGNTLWIPTVLVFVAGMIKYIERIRSLFLASMNTFRKSLKDSSYFSALLNINYAEHMEQYFTRPADTIRFSFVPPPLHHIGYLPAEQNTPQPHVELLQQGFQLFNKFKGLIVDMTFDFNYDRDFIRLTFLHKTPEDALIAIEAELNFMYEFFFTKASVLWNKVGCLFRFASFISTVAALLVFIADKKHGFSKFEIRVTYILLFGAVALDTVALLMLIFSDWSIITCSYEDSRVSSQTITNLVNNLKANLSKVVLLPFLKFKKPKWSNCKKEPFTNFKSLSTCPLFRKWSGTISGHDFITYCLHKTKEGKTNTGVRTRVVKFLKQTVHQVMDYFGVEELVETWIYKENNPFLKELWEFIFMELQRKSAFAGENWENVNRICEARGEWVLQEGELEQGIKNRLMPFVNSDEFGSFGERIMIWHIATGLCYYAYAEADQNYANANNASIDHRYFSKLLSDYMLYLLVMEPNVISTAAGIERNTILEVKSNLVDACGVVQKFHGMENQNPESFAQSACVALINAFPHQHCFGRMRNSLLHDACILASMLTALAEKRWEKVAQIWVEMLSFVALNSKPDIQVQQLSKGGQFISFVWLLMLHMGLGTRQFQKRAGGKVNLIYGS